MLLLLIGCEAIGGVSGSRSAADFMPPWAEVTLMRPEDGLTTADTGAMMGDVWSSWVTGEGPWRWTVYDGEDPTTASPIFSYDLEGTDALSLVEPPLVLLPDHFNDGDQVAEGATNVTVHIRKDVKTWYGVLPEAVELELVGELTGTLRIAPGIGPAQFSLQGQHGDLAWYR